MPVISYFFGIYVRMYHDDHGPPHIHVAYQGFEALVSIDSGEILVGRLPRKAERLIKDWCAEHHGELTENWTLAQALMPLKSVPGADND